MFWLGILQQSTACTLRSSTELSLIGYDIKTECWPGPFIKVFANFDFNFQSIEDKISFASFLGYVNFCA